MKCEILFELFFLLLRERKSTARALASRFDISERSVYRYLEELTVAGIPIDTQKGRHGGVQIADTFRLPVNFFTKDEYAAAEEALSAMYEQIPDRRFLSVLEKLRAQSKRDRTDLTVSGNILIDASSWGDAYTFTDTLRVVEDAVNNCDCLKITYLSGAGETTERVIEPLVLVFKQNIWYVHSYCHKQQDFRLFRIGRIRKASRTGEHFPRRTVNREDINLKFWHDTRSLLAVRLEFDDSALTDLEEWLGVSCIREEEHIAQAFLPDSPVLVKKLMSFGSHIRVLAPQSLIEQLKQEAERIQALYP